MSHLTLPLFRPAAPAHAAPLVAARPQLRDDQRAWLAEIDAAFRSHRVVCAQAPTGFGKTFAVATLLRDHVGRAVFLAHLDTIITDTAERLASHGVRVGIVQADRPADPAAPVQVCSLATVHARGVAPDATLVILDECHRALGPSVRAILSAYPGARILGITATPQRADGQALGDVFERIVQGPSFASLLAVGALVPARIHAPSKFLDGRLNEQPVAAWQRTCVGRRGIVFCASIEAAANEVERFNSAGIPARLMVGDTSRAERERIRIDLRAGIISVIVGVDVFREGFDEPCISAVILARAYEFTGSWLQAIGRGVRSHPGKTDCIVHDLGGSVHLLGFPDEPRVWSIDGDACVRTSRAGSIYRCLQCDALWPTPRQCPNCGALPRTMRKLPRVLRRAEEAYLMEHDPEFRAKRQAAFDCDRYWQRVHDNITRNGKPEWVARRIADKAVVTKRRNLGLD